MNGNVVYRAENPACSTVASDVNVTYAVRMLRAHLLSACAFFFLKNAICVTEMVPEVPTNDAPICGLASGSFNSRRDVLYSWPS